MDNPQSVSSQTEAVETRCGDIVRCIDTNNGITNVSSGDVTDVWDKFKLWAGNIGARQTPNSAASLESRLKGAKRVLEQVVRLLNDIQEALDDLFEIASGNSENRPIPSAPGVVSDDPTSVQSSSCNDLCSSKLQRYEDQDLLELISKSIGSLLKITVLIRKATPRDRFAKALQGTNPFMDDFDIAYVAERYPKLAGPDNRWLCERLGRAITKRRQFLRYSREHSRRIAGHGDVDTVDHQVPHHSIGHDDALSKERTRSSAPSTASGLHTNYSGSYAAHTHASTKASTLDVAQLRHVENIEAEDNDTKSYVSAGSSFQLGKADSTLHLPTLEEVSQGSEVFECPICFDIQTISRETSWRRHAFQDLKAYVCTAQGTCDNKFFGDGQSWLDHELQCHRQQWACILCQQGPFRSKRMYEDHLTQTHGTFIFGDDQLAIFVNAGLRAVDAIPARDCPFCDEWADSIQSTIPPADSTALEDVVVAVDPKQYRRHVSQHLEQLALFALPRHRDGVLNNNASEGANVSRSTIDQIEPTPPGDEYESTEEWVPDPPLHIAAARGDYEEVWRLIDDGADIHLRGETWGSALDAALSYHGVYDSRLLELFRRELEEHHVDDGAPSGGQLTPPMAPNQPDAPELPEPKKHKCPYCETSFTRHHELKSHLLTHSQEKPFVCPACRMQFRRLHDLKRHCKLHTSEGLYVCPMCGRTFARSDALEHHSQYAAGCADDRESVGPDSLDPKSNSEANEFTFDKTSISTEPLTVYEIDSEGDPSKELADIALPIKVDTGNQNTGDISQLYDTGRLRAGSSQKPPSPEEDTRSVLVQDGFVDPSRPLYEASSKHRLSSPRSSDHPRIGTNTLEESFEYTKPSDLVKYDLEHDGPRSRAERREGFDRGYYRPSPVVTSDVGRVESSRGLPKSQSRSSASDRSTHDHQKHPRYYDSINDTDGVVPRRQSVIYGYDKSVEGGADTNPRLEQPPRHPPLKGILKKPTSDFPDPPDFIREGVAPRKRPETQPIPPGARWTKISRKLVDPEALATGKERFEVRDDFVIVLRVLTREEIQAYASATAQLRERRKKDEEEKRENSRLTERVTSQLGRRARSKSPPLPAEEESALGWSTSTRAADNTALKLRTRQGGPETGDTKDP
ncbi:hypothetical protein PG993_013237 [Apiospora rasikravindrae]|uniref:C2H2-type domain-containing protein n=1 Tax=Apiospora rasikravindrae TaxID=990691 RepID=A0ABR1RX29_9PEZI